MTQTLSPRAWLTLFTSFITLMVAFSFGLFSLPAFYPSLVKIHHWNRAEVTGGGSIVLLLIGVLSPLVGILADRFGPKAVLLGGMCVGATALASLSQATSLGQYYACCTLLGLGTSAVSILPTSLVIGPLFRNWRGLAVGFINAGIGLGGVAPSLATAQIAQRGVPGAFLFLASCLAIPFVLTVLIVRSPKASTRASAVKVPTPGELGRMPMFWTFGVALFCATHAMIGVQQNLILYLTGEGIPAPRAASALSLALLAAALGKLVTGILADRASARAGMIFSVVCVLLGVLGLLSAPPESAAIFAIAFLFGTGYGGIFNATPTFVFEQFGTHQVGRAFGLFFIFFGLGTSSGGVLAGYLFDRTKQYTVPFTLDLAMACLSLAILLATSRLKRPAPMAERAAFSTP